MSPILASSPSTVRDDDERAALYRALGRLRFKIRALESEGKRDEAVAPLRAELQDLVAELRRRMSK